MKNNIDFNKVLYFIINNIENINSNNNLNKN